MQVCSLGKGDTNLEIVNIELVFKAIGIDVIVAPCVSVVCTDVL